MRNQKKNERSNAQSEASGTQPAPPASPAGNLDKFGIMEFPTSPKVPGVLTIEGLPSTKEGISFHIPEVIGDTIAQAIILRAVKNRFVFPKGVAQSGVVSNITSYLHRYMMCYLHIKSYDYIITQSNTQLTDLIVESGVSILEIQGFTSELQSLPFPAELGGLLDNVIPCGIMPSGDYILPRKPSDIRAEVKSLRDFYISTPFLSRLIGESFSRGIKPSYPDPIGALHALMVDLDDGDQVASIIPGGVKHASVGVNGYWIVGVDAEAAEDMLSRYLEKEYYTYVTTVVMNLQSIAQHMGGSDETPSR